MKFKFDYIVEVAGDALASSVVLENIAAYSPDLRDMASICGKLVLGVDGEEQPLDFSEPLVRLGYQILSKLPWVVGGDSETVALRNSAQCLAFMPAGELVALSFFEGTEAEVEEYIVEPVNVRLDDLVPQVLEASGRLVKLVYDADPGGAGSHEDYRDLVASLDEARSAWSQRQRQRRR